MKKKKPKPKFMLVYKCRVCGFDSGYTEQDKPKCRYCNKKTELTLVSKEKLTLEAIVKRMQASADNMMNALKGAYNTLPEEMKQNATEEFDPEKELLKAMAKGKSMQEKVQNLKLKKKTKRKKQ